MSRIHSTFVALLIGATAAAGFYAAVQTVRLGQKAPAPSVSPRYVASRQAKLQAWSRSLHATLSKRPPSLPKLPHFSPVAAQPVAAPVSAPAPAATPQQHVTYVKAPTVVTYKHAPAPPTTTTTTTTWSDDGSDDDGGGGDDGGHDGGGHDGGGD